MSNIADTIAARIPMSAFGTPQNVPRLVVLPMDQIAPDPEQPRKHFDPVKLQELAESIRRVGQIQPIIVRTDPANRDRFFIIAGERRYRAIALLGQTTINALVSSGNPREIALIENMQREALSPLEEAEGLMALIKQHGYRHDDLAEVIGKSRPGVTRLLSLNDLADEIKEDCRKGIEAPRETLIVIAQAGDHARQMQLWAQFRDGTLNTSRKIREAKSGATVSGTPYAQITRTLESMARKASRAGEAPSEEEAKAIRRAIRSLNKALNRDGSAQPEESAE